MRVTKYVRSDGENWEMVRIRHSAHMADAKLDDLLFKNGWVRFSVLKDKFIRLRQQLAKQTPGRDWKDVKIPMLAAKLKDLPAVIHPHIEPENDTTTKLPSSLPAKLS